MEINHLSVAVGDLFYSLKIWTDQSVGNYNSLIGWSFLFVMVSCIFFIIYTVKIGRSDERTTMISLKSAFAVLVTIIICDMIFPRSYLVNQFFMLRYGFAFLIGGIYLFLQYRKDFA